MRLPKSNLLRALLALFAWASLCPLTMFIVRARPPESLDDKAVSFVTDIVLPYVFGAFGSSYILIGLLAIVGYTLFAAGLFFNSPESLHLSKVGLLAILGLSLFTLWIEPWTSISGAATNVVAQALRFTTFLYDAFITTAWSITTVAAIRAIDQEPPNVAES
jgi:hypothetical protein